MKPRIRIYYRRPLHLRGIVVLYPFLVPPGREAFWNGPMVPLAYAMNHWQVAY